MFNLPNVLTLSNLLSGCIAVVALIHGAYDVVYGCFLASLIFDLFDGLAARALKVSSSLGAELDSLADMVSFGFFPGIVLYTILSADWTQGFAIIPFVGFIYTMSACLRLAKFNIDERQGTDFMGLNTPAASIAIVGMFAAIQNDCAYASALVDTPWLLTGIIVAISILLLADVPMVSFKPDFSYRSRTLKQGAIVGGALILFIWLKSCALPFIILWYVVFSLANLLLQKSRR